MLSSIVFFDAPRESVEKKKGRDSPNRVTPSLIFVHAEEVTPDEGTR